MGYRLGACAVWMVLCLWARSADASEAPNLDTPDTPTVVERPADAAVVGPLPVPTPPAVSPDRLTEALDAFNRRRRKESIAAMSVLLGWSVANIGVGAVGWGVAQDPKWVAFHQASIGWNTINLALAIPGLVGAVRESPESFDLGESLRASGSARLSFAFNTGLDVGWMATGAWLLERGLRVSDDRLIGFGRSMLLQGGFLFVFDLVMWLTRGVEERRFLALPVVGETLGVRAVGRF